MRRLFGQKRVGQTTASHNSSITAPTRTTAAVSVVASMLNIANVPLMHLLQHPSLPCSFFCLLFDNSIDPLVHLMTDIFLEVALDFGHEWDPEHDGDQGRNSREDEHQRGEDHDTKRKLVGVLDVRKDVTNVVQMIKLEPEGFHERDQGHYVDDLTRRLHNQMLPSFYISKIIMTLVSAMRNIGNKGRSFLPLLLLAFTYPSTGKRQRRRVCRGVYSSSGSFR